METIFLIFSNPSDYESHPEVIGFKKTKEEAQQIVNEFTNEYRTARNAWDIVIYPALSKIREKYKGENPYSVKLHDIPRWPAGIAQKNITPEMRQERDDLKKKNEFLLIAASSKAEEIRKMEMEEMQPTLKQFEDKDWFKKWFEVRDQSIICRASGLTKNNEYFIEECEEL